MGLSQYILPVNYRVVYANTCQVLRLLALTLIPPLIVALLYAEFTQALLFAVVGVVAYGVGMTGHLAGRSDMSGKEALVVVALSYLMYGFMGAFTFLSETSFINGFFESISGITTTGLSVIPPEGLSNSLLFFRSFSQWLGGLGIVILSLVILIGPSRNAFRLYTSEFGDEKLVGNVCATAGFVLVIYSILTIAGFLVYIAVGFKPFEAVIHILSTVSTGGFTMSSESIGKYEGIFLHIAVTIFMFLGAIGFPAYYLLRRQGIRSFFQDLQLRYLAGLILISWILMWGAWNWRFDRLLPGLFTSATSITTTGFTTVSVSNWPTAAVLMSIIFMVIGGSSGSTAGGIKIYRLIIVLKTIYWYILKILLPPETKIAIKIQGKAVEEDRIRQTVSLAGLYLMLAALGAICFVVYDFPVTQSIFESVSAIGTVGLSSGITSASLPAFLKIVLVLEMWIGRLEILPVLVILYPIIWIPRRS